MRFPLQCVVLQNFSGFPDTTALQRKFSMRQDISCLYTVYRVVMYPFIVSFNDSQIVCSCLDLLLEGEKCVVRDEIAAVDHRDLAPSLSTGAVAFCDSKKRTSITTVFCCTSSSLLISSFITAYCIFVFNPCPIQGHSAYVKSTIIIS